jgi:multidrug efflux pump subunit AcrA (membrane-fusion protein)
MEMAMHNDFVLDLADCTEFRQTLLARPPKIVHGTAGLMVLLLGAALAWAGATRANLVVRAPGRVRPVSTPEKVYCAARGELLGPGVGGRVVEVKARECGGAPC